METKTFRFTGHGLEEIKKTPSLPIGSRIYAFGAGMADYTFAVYSDPDDRGHQKIVKISSNFECAYFGPFHTLDGMTSPISKKFGIGFYWDDVNPNFRFSYEQIQAAILAGNKFNQEQKEKAEKQQAADNKEKSDLPGKFPYLIVNTANDWKVTKKNIVATLKHCFPEVKFSVTHPSWGHFDVSWTDGPATNDVEKQINVFDGYKFDQSGDYLDHSPSNFTNTFGDTKFLFTQREMSEETKQKLIRYLQTTFAACRGKDYSDYIPEMQERLSTLVYREFIKYDCRYVNFEIELLN